MIYKKVKNFLQKSLQFKKKAVPLHQFFETRGKLQAVAVAVAVRWERFSFLFRSSGSRSRTEHSSLIIMIDGARLRTIYVVRARSGSLIVRLCI